MAFVNEELTKQDKAFIASFKFTRPIGQIHDFAEIPSSWTVDRERNMFLICLGGQGYRYSEECPPDYYHLSFSIDHFLHLTGVETNLSAKIT